MLRLAFNILLFMCSVSCFAQHARDTTSNFVMIGIVGNPIYVSKGYSAALSYQIEVGLKKSAIYPIIQFGFCDYNNAIKAANNSSADYNIKGQYIQPGVIYYVRNPLKYKESFFISVSAYLGSFNHQVQYTVSDANWGTSRTYQFQGKQLVLGVSSSYGSIFNLYKNLKMKVFLTAGVVAKQENPITDIEGFKNITYFTPGLGFENGLALGVHAGFTYLLR